ncbi:hypothetical protein C518_4122 [Lysinibacillus fusiformis ZB2]|nr:hypothetical protein C518_4122 [Lysinibacillus fusiformis ZB2]
MILGVILKFIKICPIAHKYNLKKSLQKRYITLYYIEGRFTAGIARKMIES